MRHLSRRGFTLVELLVVIAIIGLMMAILLPVLSGVLETARRNTCANNLKQITLALQNFETHNQSLPASSMWEQEKDIEVANSPKLKANWVIQLLPYLDSQVIYEKFDHFPGTYISDDKTPDGATFHQQMRAVRLSFMECPSDSSNNSVFYNGSPFGQGTKWARGNYAANGGGGFLSTVNGPQCNAALVDGVPSGCAALPGSPGWQSPLRGVMGAELQPSNGGLAHSGNSLAKIRDPLSATIAVGEIRAGFSELDPRGVWAMGGGPSSLWASTAVIGGDNGPNANGPNDGDSFPQCSQLFTTLGITPAELQSLGMPCNPTASKSPHWQQTVRSNHPGGANVGMCDGSVHFLHESIEVGQTILTQLHTDRRNLATYNLTDLSVWDRLILVNDQQPVSLP